MSNGIQKREESIKKGHLPSPDVKVQYTFKGYIKESLAMCHNKVFILMVLGITIESIYGAGVWGFVIKVTILKFGVSSAKAGMEIGIGLIIAMIGGIMGGSLIMKKVKVPLAAKSGAKVCAILSLLYTTSSCIWLIPGCRNTNLAGVIVPYTNQNTTGALLSKCNSRCKCPESQYLPICGADGVTYHSPCFAGCTNFKRTPQKAVVYENCSCIAQTRGNINYNRTSFADTLGTQQLLNNYATVGKCDRMCKNFYVFVFFIILTSLIGGLGGIPHKIVIMRCVPDNKRSFALGMKTLIIRVFTLPAPVIIGAIVDIDCVTWSYDKCGNKKHCLDYNIDLLSEKLMFVGVITAAFGTVLYALGWWLSPNAKEIENRETFEKENPLQLMM